MQKKTNIVETLLEAIPFIKQFSGEKIVIKYGGSAQINPQLKEQFAIDIVLLYLVGIKPVIVHGGGKRINEILDKLHIKSDFVDGLRVTCKESMKIVEMVLSGEINKEIVAFLNHHGIKAIGISGKDANFIKAKPYQDGKFGYTGDITEIKGEVVDNLLNEGFVPVIAPIAAANEINHPGFNINADSVASAVAVAIKAKKVLFLTDTPGVLDKDKNLIESLNVKDVKELKENGTISGGMIPKVDACLEAINNGVQKAHIIDGRIEHAILLELFTNDGVGTEFKIS